VVKQAGFGVLLWMMAAIALAMIPVIAWLPKSPQHGARDRSSI